MKSVWEILEQIAAGQEVPAEDKLVVERWFAIPDMTPIEARQTLESFS